MMCACGEYAEVDDLCAVCHAEATFDFSVEVVESERPRYVEHARPLTKNNNEGSAQ